MALILTEDDLRELTGYRQHSKQLRWLADRLKINAPIRADGLPVVTVAQLNAAVSPASPASDDGEFTWRNP